MADLSRQLEGFLANALAERDAQAGIVRRHLPRLKRLLQRLRGIVDDSGVMAPGPGRELRVQTLTRAVANAVADEWGTPTLAAMQQELVPFFTRQLEFARDQVIQAGGTLTAPGAAVATPAVVASAVTNSVISGQTLGYSLQRSIPNLVADRVARYIRFAQPDAASGDVVYGDAVVRVTERNVEATLRSAVHSTGSFAQELIYQVESDPEWFGEDGLVWAAALDSDVCPICLKLDGQRYPVGSVKIDPHPNCVLPEAIVEAGTIAASMRAGYSGDVIRITTASGRVLSVTANHPVLTRHGWKPAKLINQGDQAICQSRQVNGSLVHEDLNQRPATARELFTFAAHQPEVVRRRVPAAPVDLHGDGESCQGNIDILAADGELLRQVVAQCGQHAGDDALIGADPELPAELVISATDQLLLAAHLAANSSMGGSDLAVSLLGGHLAPLEQLRLFAAAWRDPVFDQPFADGATVDAEMLGDLVLAHPALIEVDEVVNVEVMHVEGQDVYNFATLSGCYVADGIITHNCRCYFLPWKHEQDFIQDGKTVVRKREATGDRGEQYIPVKQTTEKWITDNPETTRRIFGRRRGDALLEDLRSTDAQVRRSALSRAVRDWQAPRAS